MHPLATSERPSPAIAAPASSPAPADAGQGVGTHRAQSILSSSSCERCGAWSLSSTHLNPGGAAGACEAGEVGSLNLASEIPSLTPDLIAEYSTQYVSSKPMQAAINCSSNPSPINSIAIPLPVEAVDIKDSVETPSPAEARQRVDTLASRAREYLLRVETHRRSEQVLTDMVGARFKRGDFDSDECIALTLALIALKGRIAELVRK